MALTISKLAAEVGVSTDTIRYYERSGLLPPAQRDPNGYRLYEAQEADRLRFIRGAQHLGLKLRDIRELLAVRDRGLCPCGHTSALIRDRLAELDEDLRRLEKLRHELVALSERVPFGVRNGGGWPCEREFIQLGEGVRPND